MELFKPYHITTEREGKLHLQLGSRHKWLRIVIYRLLPLLLSAALLATMVAFYDSFPLKIIAALAVLWIIILFMFTATINTSVNLNNQVIEIRSYRFFYYTTRSIAVADIKQLKLTIYTGGRGAGIFYKLVMHSGEAINLLNLPVFLVFDAERCRQVNEKMEHATALKIEGDLDRLVQG